MVLAKQRLLELALKGLEAERAKIDEEIAEIKRQLGGRTMGMGGGKVGSAASPPRKRRRMSAAARRRISEGMKRRYAQMRAALAAADQGEPDKPRLTPAERKKLVRRMKARWAAKKK